MTDIDARSIVGDVLDMIDAGPVGLYELVDLQRTPDSTRDDTAMVAEARIALEVLLRDGARLVWQKWGDISFSDDATGAQPRPADWRTPTDAPFLAVERGDAKRV